MIISSLSPSLARVGEERALETRGWTHPNEATLCELRLGGNRQRLVRWVAVRTTARRFPALREPRASDGGAS
jgi:hypothetical protein